MRLPFTPLHATKNILHIQYKNPKCKYINRFDKHVQMEEMKMDGYYKASAQTLFALDDSERQQIFVDCKAMLEHCITNGEPRGWTNHDLDIIIGFPIHAGPFGDLFEPQGVVDGEMCLGLDVRLDQIKKYNRAARKMGNVLNPTLYQENTAGLTLISGQGIRGRMESRRLMIEDWANHNVKYIWEHMQQDSDWVRDNLAPHDIHDRRLRQHIDSLLQEYGKKRLPNDDLFAYGVQ